MRSPGVLSDNLARVLPLLHCTVCSGRMSRSTTSGSTETLSCDRCGRAISVRKGIPRFVDDPLDPIAQRTQASFGYEWSHFSDWKPSGDVNFSDYFSGIDLDALKNSQVLDAGCGMGRHARQIAPFARTVVAVDFSAAIDAAARNVEGLQNVACVQADLTQLPFADASFDFVYSLGVVHHLEDTEGAVRGLVQKLRPGGRLRLYLYWKRTGWAGAMLRAVNGVRRVTTHLPHSVLRAVCWMLSVGLWFVVVLPYRGLLKVGTSAPLGWPLGVYSKYPFSVLYNDQFDRFSAPLEKRYTEAEARSLLESVGLRNVTARPRFGWLVDGIR